VLSSLQFELITVLPVDWANIRPVVAYIATCRPNSASGSLASASAAPPYPCPCPSPDPHPFPILCSAWGGGDAGGGDGGASDWDLLTGRVFKILKSLTFFKKLWFADNFSHCTSFFSSSMSLLSLARRFWNQVMTF